MKLNWSFFVIVMSVQVGLFREMEYNHLSLFTTSGPIVTKYFFLKYKCEMIILLVLVMRSTLLSIIVLDEKYVHHLALSSSFLETLLSVHHISS